MIEHIIGPRVSAIADKAEAEKQLKEHPKFSKTAENLTLWEEGGHWVAAWVDPKASSWERTAEFPPGGGDEEEEAPSPKGESDGGAEDAAPPKDDGGEPGEGGPPKSKKEGGGEDVKLDHEILTILQSIVDALGIAPGGAPGEEGPIPGPDGAPPGPPGAGGPPHGHGGPPGAGGPPNGPHPRGPGGPDEVIQHQRALKPGETPPGNTPIGAPAFSSVRDDHPWKKAITEKASFTVSSVIDEDTLLSPIHDQLERLAYETKHFRVAQVVEEKNDKGQRIARALITSYKE